MDWIYEPWPWYVAGPMIALVMFLLLLFGKNFGVSANLRTMCSIGGAGKLNNFFDFNWRAQVWNLIFIFGGAIGGFIAFNFLTDDTTVHISQATIDQLKGYGMENPGATYLPDSIFSWQALKGKGFIFLVGGGFLVGFGARYAGGCTSGHAISGLSDLQLPSLIAVIGFFIGGLIMSHLILPFLLTL
jgi:uncharacterized membrane protein YedE/YeeE